MMIELSPVHIPPKPDWDSKRDKEYVEELLSDDYTFDELFFRCLSTIGELSQTLRRALRFFNPNWQEHDYQNISQLIDAVEEQIKARAPSLPYLERFTEHLAVCRFVKGEFDRVIGMYLADPSLPWMAPLADLGDWLVTAEMMFEEGMACEHVGFERRRGYGRDVGE